MAYCATGSISIADWAEIKKLCKQMQDMIDARFRQLDTDTMQNLKSKLSTFETSINELQVHDAVQDKRIDDLEEVSANTPLSTSEVLEMWQGGNE